MPTKHGGEFMEYLRIQVSVEHHFICKNCEHIRSLELNNMCSKHLIIAPLCKSGQYCNMFFVRMVFKLCFVIHWMLLECYLISVQRRFHYETCNVNTNALLNWNSCPTLIEMEKPQSLQHTTRNVSICSFY